MATRKKGGGKRSRSEVITIRIDPKLKFAADLVARKQLRSLSNFVELAIEQAVRSAQIISDPEHEHFVTAYEVLHEIWAAEEMDRFINMALDYPQLLTFEEERIWSVMKDNPLFWKDGRRMSDAYVSRNDLAEQILRKKVREHWETLRRIGTGEVATDALPWPDEGYF